MDKNLKIIYTILLCGRGYKNSSGSCVDGETHIAVHLKWTMTPTGFASAMVYHHFPDRCDRTKVIKLEKVCQKEKE